MTETNLFQEVQDDLERQRFEALAKRYGGLALTAVAAVILGTAAITTYNNWNASKNQSATAALVAITSKAGSDAVEQINGFQAFADSHTGDAKASLALLRAAELEAKQGHPDNAIKIYDRLAADASADKTVRQFADLLSVRLQMDTGDVATLQQRLQPLRQADSAWRYQAAEYSGYLALRGGDKAKAKQIFTDLSQDASAPKTLTTRAADMARYLEP
jgi:hypothetical protein